MMTKTLSELASQNIIDSRDIIARHEELKNEKESLEYDVDEAKEELSKTDSADDDFEDCQEALEDADSALKDWIEENQEEFHALESIVDECSGYGDFEHGETLIAEHYFSDYVQELAEDIGAVGKNSNWVVIDWEATADNVKMDYTEVDIEGTTFYFRA